MVRKLTPVPGVPIVEAHYRMSFWRRLKRTADRIQALKITAGLFIGVFAGGVAVNEYFSHYATLKDLRAQEVIIANHSLVLARIEVDIAWIKQTLFLTATKMGANVTPPR